MDYNSNKNISKSHQFIAHILYVYRFIFPAQIRQVLTIPWIYKNYTIVLSHILKNKYPFEAISRTGNHILLHNPHELWFVSQIERIGWKEYEIMDNKISISFFGIETSSKIKVEIYNALSDGDVIGIFFKKAYGFLPTHGKTVLDIGANIGDSCVYFALHEVSRIIAIEPFPRSYELAKKNIDVNGFADKINLQLAGCAAKSGDIVVDPLYSSNIYSRLVEFKKGVKIPLFTLQDIITKNNVIRGEAVLKMDCEGCEYDVILSSADDTLTFFSHIQIEYHLGYRNLKEKLEKCGFQVWVTRPFMEYSTSFQGRTTYTGFLYAIKREEKS